MAIRWEALTIDARDLLGLARWWAETLSWDVVDLLPAGVEVRQPERECVSLFFVVVSDLKNRLHLDLYVDDQDGTVAALEARGATRTDVGQSQDAAHIVMRDPEGNEFCLLDPR
ncbi:VOC family protein [Pseudonocardia alni]|uniref:VOC family protein n=1 Tax=Pseudonocardia alni TaxID=33907 RepID=UPI001AD7009A|nr:VOC family protein [Pseudonocardia alni]MBO4241491.1 VOC family protein [Pseudonocardia alni]